MDISSNQLKTMKSKQLRGIIREAPYIVTGKVKKGDISTIKKYTQQGIDVQKDKI